MLLNNQQELFVKRKKVLMFIKKHCLGELQPIMNGEDLNKQKRILRKQLNLRRARLFKNYNVK